MTKEEARKFLSNKKVFVKNKSKEIQLKLFEIGFGWDGGSTQKPSYLNKPFLFMYKDMALSHGDDVDYFYKNRFEEISAEDILNIKVEHLPKTWKEFCEKHPINDGEVAMTTGGDISNLIAGRARFSYDDRYSLPSRSAAEAHRALMQLHQLRDCYRQGWVPDWSIEGFKCCILKSGTDIKAEIEFTHNHFLSFQTYELAQQFLNNFRELIEQAGDLI